MSIKSNLWHLLIYQILVNCIRWFFPFGIILLLNYCCDYTLLIHLKIFVGQKQQITFFIPSHLAPSTFEDFIIDYTTYCQYQSLLYAVLLLFCYFYCYYFYRNHWEIFFAKNRIKIRWVLTKLQLIHFIRERHSETYIALIYYTNLRANAIPRLYRFNCCTIFTRERHPTLHYNLIAALYCLYIKLTAVRNYARTPSYNKYWFNCCVSLLAYGFVNYCILSFSA